MTPTNNLKNLAPSNVNVSPSNNGNYLDKKVAIFGSSNTIALGWQSSLRNAVRYIGEFVIKATSATSLVQDTRKIVGLLSNFENDYSKGYIESFFSAHQDTIPDSSEAIKILRSALNNKNYSEIKLNSDKKLVITLIPKNQSCAAEAILQLSQKQEKIEKIIFNQHFNDFFYQQKNNVPENTEGDNEKRPSQHSFANKEWSIPTTHYTEEFLNLRCELDTKITDYFDEQKKRNRKKNIAEENWVYDAITNITEIDPENSSIRLEFKNDNRYYSHFEFYHKGRLVMSLDDEPLKKLSNFSIRTDCLVDVMKDIKIHLIHKIKEEFSHCDEALYFKIPCWVNANENYQEDGKNLLTGAYKNWNNINFFSSDTSLLGRAAFISSSYLDASYGRQFSLYDSTSTIIGKLVFKDCY